MLCKRTVGRVDDAVKEMQGSQFLIEEKLDGERLQLHKRGNEYFYCSRFTDFCAAPGGICQLTISIQEGQRLYVPLWKARRARKLDAFHRQRV